MSDKPMIAYRVTFVAQEFLIVAKSEMEARERAKKLRREWDPTCETRVVGKIDGEIR
jgi:hypothetical protein